MPHFVWLENLSSNTWKSCVFQMIAGMLSRPCIFILCNFFTYFFLSDISNGLVVISKHLDILCLNKGWFELWSLLSVSSSCDLKCFNHTSLPCPEVFPLTLITGVNFLFVISQTTCQVVPYFVCDADIQPLGSFS